MTAMVLVPALIGLLLLASALAKAIDLGFAARQLAEYGLVPLRWSGWLAGAISVTEAWLAAALLLDAGRGFVPILSVATIGVATPIALWRGLSRGLADCGCHGRLVALSPLQSAAIHTMGCAVLAACWWLAPPAPVRPWGLVAASAVAALAAVCAWRSLHRGALIDVSLLRAGRRFPARALARFGTPPVDPARQDALVALLSPGCARCVAWARVLDRCATLDGELPVLGLLGGSAKEAEAFRSQNRLRMPLMPVGTAGLLVLGNVAPMAAEVRGGVVVDVWTGHLPARIVDRVRDARARETSALRERDSDGAPVRASG